jgi:hypothetical protein
MISNYLNTIEPEIAMYDNERIVKAFRKRHENSERIEKELQGLLED